MRDELLSVSFFIWLLFLLWPEQTWEEENFLILWLGSLLEVQP